MAQRVGPVTIDDNFEDDDLTVIQVPSEAVGFVTGSQGNFLRQVEEEWGTLMFFADFRGRGERQEVKHACLRAPPPHRSSSSSSSNCSLLHLPTYSEGERRLRQPERCEPRGPGRRAPRSCC